MGKQINEREVVLEILMEITENGAYSHKILGDVLSKYQYLEKRERAFITRVVEGTLEHMIEIDYILNQISKTKVKKMKPVIRNLLRSSVYQLKYMDSVPDHAVCSEAVKLAVRKGFSGLRGYVNGVLRNVVRKMDEIEYPKEDVQRLSVKYSVPEWILSLWKKEYGEEITEKMAADFQKEKPITIRCFLIILIKYRGVLAYSTNISKSGTVDILPDQICLIFGQISCFNPSYLFFCSVLSRRHFICQLKLLCHMK